MYWQHAFGSTIVVAEFVLIKLCALCCSGPLSLCTLQLLEKKIKKNQALYQNTKRSFWLAGMSRMYLQATENARACRQTHITAVYLIWWADPQKSNSFYSFAVQNFYSHASLSCCYYWHVWANLTQEVKPWHLARKGLFLLRNDVCLRQLKRHLNIRWY